jgi:hypothetical protein
MSTESYNAKQLADGNLTWEMITELGRHWQRTHPPLTIDGYIGPGTQASLDIALHPEPEEVPEKWPPFDGPLEAQPKNRTEVYQLFGDPGAGQVDPSWEKVSIVELHGERAFPGVPSNWYFKINTLVEPYAREAFRRASLSSPYVIKRAASFVFRHIRYDDAEPLSYPSWGIAIDIDSDNNFAKWFKLGQCPVPWSPEWMEIWPRGVDKAFVDAMASCGFRWGGYWKTYCDPMHFEWLGKRPV